MDHLEHNRRAWNRQATSGTCRWSQPVDADAIARARAGDWRLILTPTRSVPRDWFGEVRDRDVLCLASGGGQQAPLLAAAGARVTSFDLSPEQLALDARVAREHDLDLTCVEGDMAVLSAFADASFDLIFHPVSNVFVPDVRPVWRECFRVLRPGGRLLAGFMNPSLFLFEPDEADATGELVVRYRLPLAEPDGLTEAARQALFESGRPLEFSHSIETQIGGQLDAGLRLLALYEDEWKEDGHPLDAWSPTSIATLAEKPRAS